MTHEDDVDPKRITKGMRANIEALSSTADMTAIILEEVEQKLHRLQDHYEKLSQSRYDDWRVINTFLRLALAQVEIVKETSDAFHYFQLQASQ